MKSQDTLRSALEAFIREHESCGELDSGVQGDRVWMTCTCGARVVRRIQEITDVEGRLTAPAGLCATPGDAAARGLMFHVHIL